jgi:hypothetical protein
MSDDWPQETPYEQRLRAAIKEWSAAAFPDPMNFVSKDDMPPAMRARYDRAIQGIKDALNSGTAPNVAPRKPGA